MRKKYDVSRLEFVLAWMTADSLEEVSRRTGIPVPICSARAGLYREQGIELPHMGEVAKFDTDLCNAFVKHYQEANSIGERANAIREFLVSKTRNNYERIIETLWSIRDKEDLFSKRTISKANECLSRFERV